MENTIKTSKLRQRLTTYFILGTLALLLIPIITNAFVRYAPSASLTTGDITTTHILDGTILDDDIATTTYWDWDAFQTGSTTGASFNFGTTTGQRTGGFSFGDGDTGVYESADDNLIWYSANGDDWILFVNGTFGSSAGKGVAIINDEPASTSPQYRWRDDPDTGITSASPDYLGLLTGGVEALVIASDQNIGIGTTSPYEKLSVHGNVVADMFFATSTTATSTFTAGIEVGANGIRFSDGSVQTGSGDAITTLFVDGTSQANSGTASTTLASITIPANRLTTGSALRFTAFFTSTDGGSGNNVYGILFGDGVSSSTLYSFNSGNTNDDITGLITVQSTSAQVSRFYRNYGSVQPVDQTETTTGVLFLSVIGKNGNASDTGGMEGIIVEIIK